MSEKDLGKRIKLLEKQMLDHARNLEFEKAARVRDQLALLREQAFGAPGARCQRRAAAGAAEERRHEHGADAARPDGLHWATSAARRRPKAVLRQQLAAAGLHAEVEVDSAGTRRLARRSRRRITALRRHGARRGYDLSRLRARQLRPTDFERFDLILAMDADNLAACSSAAPDPHRDKLRLLMDFSPGRPPGAEVPDPYYGGAGRVRAGARPGREACDGDAASPNRAQTRTSAATPISTKSVGFGYT